MRTQYHKIILFNSPSVVCTFMLSIIQVSFLNLAAQKHEVCFNIIPLSSFKCSNVILLYIRVFVVLTWHYSRKQTKQRIWNEDLIYVPKKCTYTQTVCLGDHDFTLSFSFLFQLFSYFNIFLLHIDYLQAVFLLLNGHFHYIPSSST
jgi:hypothetical protein